MIDFISVEDPLSAVDLRIDRDQSPHGLGTIQIGNGSQEMGQILKEMSHSPTFIVDEQEAHIMRMEVDGEGEDQLYCLGNRRADK